MKLREWNGNKTNAMKMEMINGGSWFPLPRGETCQIHHSLKWNERGMGNGMGMAQLVNKISGKVTRHVAKVIPLIADKGHP